MPIVSVPAARVERWVANFAEGHGGASYDVVEGRLRGDAVDGAWFTAALPFERSYDGPPAATGLSAAAAPPDDWGVLLVRKGGFAVARLAAGAVVESKVGQRHVQGRTKAGGQSQQRFARRRDNQARDAYRAAAEHAARILDGLSGPVVTGGDKAAVAEVLTDPRLASLAVVGPWLAVPDPRRAVLDAAVETARAVRIEVDNGPRA